MKKVIAFNGSYRTNFSGAQILKEILKGAESVGAETELVHLGKLQKFSGCISCLGCKRRGAAPGFCSIKDDFTPYKEKIAQADAIILESPIYYGRDGALSAKFQERVLFPWYRYGPEKTLFPKKLKTALVYTMNATEEQAKAMGYTDHFESMRKTVEMILRGKCEVLPIFDTLQVKDYAKYHLELFDADHKYQRRKESFPEDLKKAFELGKRLGQ